MPLPYPLILASKSPRRRELLATAGYHFDVVPPPMGEPPPSTNAALAPIGWAEAMAYFKARSVAQSYIKAIIIGADTIVVHGDTIIGKPADKDQARYILENAFAGRNEIISGLALLCPPLQRRIITHVRTVVFMRRMEPHELEEYLAGDAWRDKAGAYAFQEGGDKFVQSIAGSRSNIVGLPLEKLEQILRQFERPYV